MKTSWKKLLTAASAAIFCAALLTGCLGSKGLGPDAPKEPVAKFKLGDKEVPLYEYKGAELPDFETFHSNLALTKDAIYGISRDAADNKYHLKKMNLKDGAIVSVEDLGLVAMNRISSDATNIYYIGEKEPGTIGCYDGKAATVFKVVGVSPSEVRTIFGGKNAYLAADHFDRSGILFGEISKEGVKDTKVVLPPEEFKKYSSSPDNRDGESNPRIRFADKDGFYLLTEARHGDKETTLPLHMYGPDGKKLRTFECNEGIPADAKKRDVGLNQTMVSKDYVIFCNRGYMRIFDKKDGKYVGDIELELGDQTLRPEGITVDEENHIYFVSQSGKDPNYIYRIDL